MANAQAAKFQKTAGSAPTVSTNRSSEDETLKSNVASKVCFFFLMTNSYLGGGLSVLFPSQDEKVPELAVDALKNVSPETEQRQKGQEKDQVV